MRSTQVITVLALLATSVSSMSIGSPNQVAHRRHASSVTHDSVLQARGARKYVPEQDIAKREETAPHWGRKRGINQRRCAAKSSSSSAALAASTSSAAATSTPEPEPTSSSAAAKYTKSVEAETTTKPATTSKAENTKTSTKATKTSTSAAAATSSSSSSSSGSNTGEGTFYGTGLGACGIVNVDTDYICAVSQSLFDGFDGYTGSDPNSNPICGKKIKATYEGKSVTVTVTDRCVGCAYNDLDFSPSAFDQLADQSVGRLKGMTWVWVS